MFAAAYLEGIEDGSRYRLFGRNGSGNDDARAESLRAALDAAVKHVSGWPDREEEVEPEFATESRPRGFVAANDANGSNNGRSGGLFGLGRNRAA